MTQPEFQQLFVKTAGTDYPLQWVRYASIKLSEPSDRLCRWRLQALLWEFRLCVRRIPRFKDSLKSLSGFRLVALEELQKIKPCCDPKEWDDCFIEVASCIRNSCLGLSDQEFQSPLKQGDTEPSYRPPTIHERLRDGFSMLSDES